MGKGDRKSKRGKIWRGSHGNTRPKKRQENPAAKVKPAGPKEKPAE